MDWKGLCTLLLGCRKGRNLTQDTLARRMQELGETIQEKTIRSRFLVVERDSYLAQRRLLENPERTNIYLKALNPPYEEGKQLLDYFNNNFPWVPIMLMIYANPEQPYTTSKAA